MILDFHTHTFPDAICEKTLHHLSMASATIPFSDGSVHGLIASMQRSGVDYSVNLPVMTSPAQVEKVNSSMLQRREELLQQGIICFGGLHPDYEPVTAELRRLKAGGIRGIKLHPAYQNIDLDDPRMLRIFAAASEEDMIVVVHAGIDIGIYDHDYASVDHVLHVMKEVAPTKLVLAHMGGWGRWEDVERDLAGAPLYLDTAFSIGAITENPAAPHAPIRTHNLKDEDFVRLVRKHGTGKVLFATDSPWADQAAYVAQLQAMALTPKEKADILGNNALRLLQASCSPK